MNKTIFLVDIQSFYASIEKAYHPEWKNKPVIVSGDPKKRSGIILAACPLAKKFGIQTTEPLWQAKQKCSHAIIVQPHMQLYVNLSCLITSILEQYTSQVEVFSIDEQFMDMTHILTQQTPFDAAKAIQQEIMESTGVYARIGIAPNKLLAKMACDAFAKKNSTGIFHLNFTNMQDTMWPLPVQTLFHVGSRMKKHLEAMGIQTIGQLANFPLQRLKKRWGINGIVLWQLANGIDESLVKPETHEYQKAIGHHMTLPYDYAKQEDIRVVLLELCEKVGRRIRTQRYIGQTVSLNMRYGDFNLAAGFNRQITLLNATDDGQEIYEAVLYLFNLYWDFMPIRSIGISVSNLQSSETRQLSLFNTSRNKERLNQVLDDLHDTYGPTAVFHAASLTTAGQVHERAKKIGGHYK